jgi:hypothetical protein
VQPRSLEHAAEVHAAAECVALCAESRVLAGLLMQWRLAGRTWQACRDSLTRTADGQ